MSKFSIDLQHLSLPDAIAAVVEAWYDAQSIDDAQIEIAIPKVVRLSDWIESSGLSRSTAYELLRILQIEPEARRVSTSRKPVSHLSAEQIQRLQPWANKIKHGATLPRIREQTQNQLAELVDQLPLSRSSVFELVKALGITTEKGPGPGGKGRVAWVSDADADRLADAANRVHRGEVRIADLAANMDHPSLL